MKRDDTSGFAGLVLPLAALVLGLTSLVFAVDCDLIKDGCIDFKDLDAFAEKWLADCSVDDCNGANFNDADDRIDFADFAIFAQHWLELSPPLKATCLYPPNGAADVDINANLSWIAGVGATSHDVYLVPTKFGFQGNQPHTSFDPGTMYTDATYYWRIDEKNDGGTTTGDVWSFTTITADPALVGWWRLDAGLGDTAVDYSGSGYHGTLLGAVDWAPAGDAASFAGGDGRVEIPTTGISTSAGTIALWGRLEGPQSQRYRFFFGDRTGGSGDTNRVQLYMKNNTNLNLGLGDSHTLYTDIMTLNTDTWYYIALTWGGGSGSDYVVYVDGVGAVTGTHSAIGTLSPTANIGNSGEPAPSGGFFGLIDDVRIWNRVLGASEILDIYNRGIPARPPVPPAAAFSASPTTGAVPLSAAFTDESTGDGLASWQWDFGDGSPPGTEQNPVHLYDTEGLYSVTLTVTGILGSDVLTRADYINVTGPQPAVADFSASPLSGFAPMDVNFTDLSTGSVTGWDWDFGDGGTSTEQHPAHTYGQVGTYTVTLTVTGPLNSDTETKADYITTGQPLQGGSGLAIVDSPDDLTNTHPHLWCRGYGPDNGLWQKAQTTHSEIWNRLSDTARTGPWGGLNRTNGQELMRSAMAFVISKDPGFGNHCRSAVLALNGHYFSFTDPEMEPFYAYCLAYDAIVDDPETTWLTPSQKTSALATMANMVSRLNMSAGATWRLRPTHNYMVLRAAMHAAAMYNLRGEPGYESAFNTARGYCLAYHNERVNGLCNAPLTNNGPRPTDGFPYEGPQYGAYQASRALIHRHILEMNEYPNPPTVLDENLSGFSQNYNLAWMALALPGASRWADVCHRGDHGMLQGIRHYSAINKAVGNGIMAGVGEWFHNEILPGGIGGSNDHGWWQGWEMFWYDTSITPIHPNDAGIGRYIHLDDSEFHMYRDTWDLYPGSPDDTYVYFRNSAHDGHNYWAEGHSGPGVSYNCIAQTSSHDGADNGHFGIYRDGRWLAENNDPDGQSNGHNCLMIDGALQIMKTDGDRGYEVPELAGTDCIGAVDSDYGHALDAIIGPAYRPGTVDNYHRYFFVIRDPMYVLVVDEVESGHTIYFYCYAEQGATRRADGLYTSSRARYELMYPQSGFTSSSGTEPIMLSTSSPQLMFLAHANPSGVTVSRSYSGGQMIATIGEDDIVYNPGGGTYSHGNISGNAKLFAERTDGALIFGATTASGSQYGISCDAAVNMSVSGRKASIYIYGTGTHTVHVTSPYGVDAFDIEAGRTVERVLTGLSVPPPVAEFFAAPTYGWHGYYKAELVSLSTGWITDYLWQFGDGQSSTELAPTHQYVMPGFYTVKLTVSGPGGSDTITKTDYIEVKDFSDYGYPDYVLTEPTQAAFDAALDAIEASQSPGLAPGDPTWCGGSWCGYVKHGGGGRILFDASIADSTIGIDWQSRPGEKRDWFGDNLIIDGQDRNIRFVYVGSQPCGQAENMSCLRIHGNDNIVRNITWDRFPDGLHMRGGQRNLIENVTVNTVCEDAISLNGSDNVCIECIIRDCTYGASQDKTLMYNNGGTLGSAIINGMHSTNGNQPIRMTGGGRLVVRNSNFLGSASNGPRFGGNKNLVIFENNRSAGTKNGLRLSDKVNIIVRHNSMENCRDYGINCWGDDYVVCAKNNIIRNCGDGGVRARDQGNIDLGGGLLDVHRWSAPWIDPASPCTDPVPSWGQNILRGNGGYEVDNQTTLGNTLKAEHNFWDYNTVSQVQATEIGGNVDVDPLGIDID